MNIDVPGNGAAVRQPFAIAGWALDATAQTGTGITTLHVWAFPASGAAPRFVGVAGYGGARPDVGAAFGTQFTPSGFSIEVSGFAPGAYQFMVFGWVAALNGFNVVRTVNVTIGSSALLVIDLPQTLVDRRAHFPARGMDVRLERPGRHRHRHDSRVGLPRRGRRAKLCRSAGVWRVTAGRRRVLRQPLYAERLQLVGVHADARYVRPGRLFSQRRDEQLRRGAGGAGHGAIDRFRVQGSGFRVRSSRFAVSATLSSR